jgi:hypothetical protein
MGIVAPAGIAIAAAGRSDAYFSAESDLRHILKDREKGDCRSVGRLIG